MKRKLYIAISLCLLLLCFTSCQSDDGKKDNVEKHNISILKFGSHPVLNTIIKGFNMRMEVMFPEETYDIVQHNANFDRTNLSTMSRNMASSNSDILISVTTPATNALLAEARGTRKVLFSFVSDPTQVGYTGAGSIEKTTGITDRINYNRVLNLISKINPKAEDIGYLITKSESNAQYIYNRYQKKATKRGFNINEAYITGPSDIQPVARSLAGDVDLFLFGGDNTIANNMSKLLSVANSNDIPVYANDSESVKNGALIGVSVEYEKFGKRTAEMATFILAGADPSELPMERFKADQLILNKSTANRLDINIPRDITSNADKIIE